jgi:hypothetical protein
MPSLHQQQLQQLDTTITSQQLQSTSTKPSHISNDSMDSSYCSNALFEYKTQQNDLLADNVPLNSKPKSAGLVNFNFYYFYFQQKS